MTELELIIDLHRGSERQGPGSTEETLRALRMIKDRDRAGLKIADIGCGTGGPTLTLAKNLSGLITAVDLSNVFLEELNERAVREGVSTKIKTLQASMAKLPFSKESLDIIWSEGAIYNIGFKKGVAQWREFLKPGGWLCLTEITWISSSRPKEIEDFWNREYPEIDTAARKITILENSGYSLVGYFYLSQESWLDNYYHALESRFSEFLIQHRHSEMAQNTVRLHAEEIALYRQYKDYFSYGFYIARKN